MVCRAQRVTHAIVVRSKKKLTSGGSPATTEKIILMAQKLGLSVADLNEFTVAMMNDLAVEMVNEEEQDDAREATQADYDAF